MFRWSADCHIGVPPVTAKALRLRDEHDFSGGYAIVNDYVWLKRMSQREMFAPLHHPPYESLPNELSRVAGIISTVPQTPLSHVNLRAVQDGVPNAFIDNALDNRYIDGAYKC